MWREDEDQNGEKNGNEAFNNKDPMDVSNDRLISPTRNLPAPACQTSGAAKIHERICQQLKVYVSLVTWRQCHGEKLTPLKHDPHCPKAKKSANRRESSFFL